MRGHYVKELQNLQDELLVLGSMVIQVLCDAVDILKRQDVEGARRLIANDREINARRFRIEENCLILIATQQPMARDMRLLASILEIAGELERMGDYGKGIAKITLYIGKQAPIKPLVHMPQMGEKVVAMLRAALDAFINQDVIAARAIPQRDDEVDELYNIINRELIEIIIANRANIDQANYFSWAAHNLERAADRVTNICERIIYTVTGELIEMDVKDENAVGLKSAS